ncbi:unnamed protein product [Auanema sp. JU1783]|nr:unnamed protein product [Auanema sp. JU1783]
MSMVELRRNSSPHLGSLPLQSTSGPVWRKASHPPLKNAKPSTSPTTLATRERSVSPGVYHRMLYHSEDLKSLIQSITHEAKSIIKAETCSLFLLDKENKELVAKVFDRAENLSEIRLPMDKGVVGRVATTRTMMNVRDVNRCPFFYTHVDEVTGFHTRNILCFPIIDNAGTFVGVVELCNKEGKSGFTRYDEQKARTFAVYCATSLSHCLLYRKVQEAQRRTHMASEWVIKNSPYMINPKEVEALSVNKIKPWHDWHEQFDKFSFAPRIVGDSFDYAAAAMTMFDDLGFLKLYHINQRTLANFVLRVANGYRDVPYHNWSHAFAVAHFCWLTLKTKAVRHGLDEMERLSLLIACLCHDIDHRGTSNNFQVQTNTPLAQLYSSEGSVLERHHYAQTVTILRDSNCNILDQLTRTQYQRVMNHIRDIILATDISAHLQKLGRIKEMVGGYNYTSHDHRYLFMCLLMTASDLSDQSKDFSNSKAIAENIYREFFSQGDMEKQNGSEPLEMMDRERANVPKIQLEFMDDVALPVFEMLSKLVPEGISTYRAISHNRKCWKALDVIMKNKKRSGSSLEYLRDKSLEQEVLKAVAESDKEEKEATSRSSR